MGGTGRRVAPFEGSRALKSSSDGLLQVPAGTREGRLDRRAEIGRRGGGNRERGVGCSAEEEMRVASVERVLAVPAALRLDRGERGDRSVLAQVANDRVAGRRLALGHDLVASGGMGRDGADRNCAGNDQDRQEANKSFRRQWCSGRARPSRGPRALAAGSLLDRAGGLARLVGAQFEVEELLAAARTGLGGGAHLGVAVRAGAIGHGGTTIQPAPIRPPARDRPARPWRLAAAASDGVKSDRQTRHTHVLGPVAQWIERGSTATSPAPSAP